MSPILALLFPAQVLAAAPVLSFDYGFTPGSIIHNELGASAIIRGTLTNAPAGATLTLNQDSVALIDGVFEHAYTLDHRDDAIFRSITAVAYDSNGDVIERARVTVHDFRSFGHLSTRAMGEPIPAALGARLNEQGFNALGDGIKAKLEAEAAVPFATEFVSVVEAREDDLMLNINQPNGWCIPVDAAFNVATGGLMSSGVVLDGILKILVEEVGQAAVDEVLGTSPKQTMKSTGMVSLCMSGVAAELSTVSATPFALELDSATDAIDLAITTDTKMTAMIKPEFSLWIDPSAVLPALSMPPTQVSLGRAGVEAVVCQQDLAGQLVADGAMTSEVVIDLPNGIESHVVIDLPNGVSERFEGVVYTSAACNMTSNMRANADTLVTNMETILLETYRDVLLTDAEPTSEAVVQSAMDSYALTDAATGAPVEISVDWGAPVLLGAATPTFGRGQTLIATATATGSHTPVQSWSAYAAPDWDLLDDLRTPSDAHQSHVFGVSTALLNQTLLEATGTSILTYESGTITGNTLAAAAASTCAGTYTTTQIKAFLAAEGIGPNTELTIQHTPMYAPIVAVDADPAPGTVPSPTLYAGEHEITVVMQDTSGPREMLRYVADFTGPDFTLGLGESDGALVVANLGGAAFSTTLIDHDFAQWPSCYEPLGSTFAQSLPSALEEAVTATPVPELQSTAAQGLVTPAQVQQGYRGEIIYLWSTL